MLRNVVLLITALGIAQAHDTITTKITWSKEMSRLVFKRCVMCHNEKASIPLMTYEQARPWAKAIKEEALERRMPPWEAVKGFGDFTDDRGLTQEELELISDWVEGGAPEGDPKYVPAAPKPVDWLDQAVPKGTSEVVVSANQKLTAAAKVVAVRPKDLKAGATVQIVAVRPDGSLEPILWIYQYKPDFKRTYYYRTPLSLPAGTTFQMSPPDAGTIGVFTKNAMNARR
jgi:hypothetical protein